MSRITYTRELLDTAIDYWLDEDIAAALRNDGNVRPRLLDSAVDNAFIENTGPFIKILRSALRDLKEHGEFRFQDERDES